MACGPDTALCGGLNSSVCGRCHIGMRRTPARHLERDEQSRGARASPVLEDAEQCEHSAREDVLEWKRVERGFLGGI